MPLLSSGIIAFAQQFARLVTADITGQRCSIHLLWTCLDPEPRQAFFHAAGALNPCDVPFVRLSPSQDI